MHLPEAARVQVSKILRRHLPPLFAAHVFGSRANGRKLKPFSDLNLCVIGPEPLPADLLQRMRAAFEESDLPFKVDLVDWHGLSAEFSIAITPDLKPFF